MSPLIVDRLVASPDRAEGNGGAVGDRLHHRPYLCRRKFVLITDGPALGWLLKGQTLSPKPHRWTLWLMNYNMDLHETGGAPPVARYPVEAPSE